MNKFKDFTFIPDNIQFVLKTFLNYLKIDFEFQFLTFKADFCLDQRHTADTTKPKAPAPKLPM